MPRYRIQFTKEDRVRFLSHLDLVKAFERAIRRAGIPIAFSEGFNPHPKMSFASALAVGVTSDAEYIDLELSHEMDIYELQERLAAGLPPGISVKAVREVPDSSLALMAQVNRAAYEVVAPAGEPVNQDELDSKVDYFLKTPEIMITKRTKKGPRPKNIRPGIFNLKGTVDGDQVIFSMVTAAGEHGNVRPEEVICALNEQSAVGIDCESLYIRRRALYVEKDGELISPMDIIE